MSDLLVEISGGVARLTLNRPEQRNALTTELISLLRQALREASADCGVRVITLTGAGDQAFCAGADLKSTGTGVSGYRELLLDLWNCETPTVALARGSVLAGGLGIFLACDLALACDNIHFSTPEINVGMFPMMVTALLRQSVGSRHLAELAFLGDRISAAEAFRLGLANRVCPRGDFDREAEDFVGKIAAKSGAILKLGKAAMRRTRDLAVDEALPLLEAALAQVMASPDSQEGRRAFVEKRKPEWSHL